MYVKQEGALKKLRDLTIIAGIYVLAFVVGCFACRGIDNVMLRYFIFDIAATIVTFVFSTILVNSSVYDAYWSLTPMIMSVWLFAEYKAFSVMQVVLLIAFNIWSVRLTANWVIVFTDFSYEDWRYRKFRDETHKLLWPIVNFWGIHMIPTLVVFAGMLPLFEAVKNPLGLFSIPGIAVMLAGVLLEFFADRHMHRFLRETKDKSVCRLGLWNYSRHPNYLGEITFWLGVYLAVLPYAPAFWYYGAGFASVALLFNVVSIPLMEKRQLRRRPEYRQYCADTARLLLLPKRSAGGR